VDLLTFVCVPVRRCSASMRRPALARAGPPRRRLLLAKNVVSTGRGYPHIVSEFSSGWAAIDRSPTLAVCALQRGLAKLTPTMTSVPGLKVSKALSGHRVAWRRIEELSGAQGRRARVPGQFPRGGTSPSKVTLLGAGDSRSDRLESGPSGTGKRSLLASRCSRGVGRSTLSSHRRADRASF
jgi:hypothetical protein